MALARTFTMMVEVPARAFRRDAAGRCMGVTRAPNGVGQRQGYRVRVFTLRRGALLDA